MLKTKSQKMTSVSQSLVM